MIFVSYQVEVTAVDLAPNPLSSRVTVTINIIRNDNAPVFINEPYGGTISSAIGVGTSLLTVTATDADTVVSNELKLISLLMIDCRVL